MQTNSDITTMGDLIINGTLDIGTHNSNLELKGDLTNNGTFSTSGETITFSGVGAKSCSAISDPVLDVIVNKSSGGSITFEGACSFDELSINNGDVIISNNTVNCDNTVTISDGSVLQIGSGTFDADGVFNANTSGTIDFTGNGKLQLSSTVTSLGTLDDAQGKVVYDGSAAQVMAADTYYDLQLNNSAGAIKRKRYVNGTLTLGNGDLTSSSTKKLTVKNSTSGGNDNGHIVGPFNYSSTTTNEVILHVGDGLGVHPIKIKPVSATAQTYGIEHFNGSPGYTIDNSDGLQYVNNTYYYDISRSGSVNAYLSLPLSGLDSVTLTDLCIGHYTSSNRWERVAPTSTPPNMNDYVRGLITSFSPFTVGSNGLPLGDDPLITVSGSFSLFDTCSGLATTAQVIQVSGEDLVSPITVNAPTGYELSKTASGTYSDQLTFNQSSGTVPNSNVYVRLKSTATNGASENVVFTSTNAATVNKPTGTAVIYLYYSRCISSTSVVCENQSISITGSLVVVLVWAMPMLGQDLMHFPHLASLTVTNGATTSTMEPII